MRHRYLAVLVVGIAVTVWLLAGCGEKAVQPGVEDQATADLGATPDAADIGREVDGVEIGRIDFYDAHFVPGTFLIATAGGIVALRPDGESFLFSDYSGREIEIVGTRIFVRQNSQILELDHSGDWIDIIEDPEGLGNPVGCVALSAGKFALLNNASDSVYIVTSGSTLLASVAMPDSSPGQLQNVCGVRVGDRLVLSETGNKQVMEMDLTTYDLAIFRDFGDDPLGWLGDIDYRGGRFYLARPRMLQRFTETGDLEDIWDTGEEEHPVGIEFLGDYAYVALNFAGKIYKVNLLTGAAEVLMDGLAMPSDIEYIDIRLEEPPGSP